MREREKEKRKTIHFYMHEFESFDRIIDKLLTGKSHFAEVQSIVVFNCKKLTYVWDTERSEFLKLRGLDIGVLNSSLHQMQGLSAQEQYMR